MRKLIVYERHFSSFFEALPESDQRKIEWVLRVVTDSDRVPANYFRYLSRPGIYEIRVIHRNIQYRICCFLDTDRRLVLLNAFKKRSRKTPRKEIRKAIRLYKKYYYEKERS